MTKMPTPPAIHDQITAIEIRLLHARMNWAGSELLLERADEINNTSHGASFLSIQRAFQDLAIIQTSALFDDSKRNKTRSIPRLLALLRSASESRPTMLETRFRNLLPNANPVTAFFQFAERYKTPPLSVALSNVRTRRDQELTHFDEAPRGDDLRYEHVEALIEHCKTVLRMASTCFGTVVVGPSDELLAHLSLDKRADLRRLVDTLAKPKSATTPAAAQFRGAPP